MSLSDPTDAAPQPAPLDGPLSADVDADQVGIFTGAELLDLYHAAAELARIPDPDPVLAHFLDSLRALLARAQELWTLQVPAGLFGDVRRAAREDDPEVLRLSQQRLAHAKEEAIVVGSFVLQPTLLELESIAAAIHWAANTDEVAWPSRRIINRLHEHAAAVGLRVDPHAARDRGLKGLSGRLRRR